MASLANLPTLRRTITDIMEDELYHIPGQGLLRSSSASNDTVNSSLFQEALSEHQMLDNSPLMEADEDMLIDEADAYYDDEDENLNKLYTPEAFNVQPFNAYANPNVFNSYNNQLHQASMIHQDPFRTPRELPMTVSPRDAHIKLPEELLGADSNNPLFDPNYDSTQQLFVWPNENGKELFADPEELYFDEISDDEDDEELIETDMNYFDVSLELPSFSSTPLLAENSPPLREENLSRVHDQVESQDKNNKLLGEANEDSRPSKLVLYDSSAGPDGMHMCTLINHATNQPCNKHFSRPYDLVRHQETIHASKKKVYRCFLCEEDFNKSGNARLSNKTFSRGDALSRHIRVKHGLSGNEANELIKIAKDNVEYIDVAQ